MKTNSTPTPNPVSFQPQPINPICDINDVKSPLLKRNRGLSTPRDTTIFEQPPALLDYSNMIKVEMGDIQQSHIKIDTVYHRVDVSK